MQGKKLNTPHITSHHILMLSVPKIARHSNTINTNVETKILEFYEIHFWIQPMHINSNLRYQNA